MISKLTMNSGNINNVNPITLGTGSSNTGVLDHSNGLVLGALKRYFANSNSSAQNTLPPLEMVLLKHL